MSDLISVVIPVYNMGVSLEKCVASILQQEGVNMEIVLVDDGSKDDSWQRCQRLASEHAFIRAFHTENRGQGPARNFGIEQASGRYVYFPDADDILAPHALRRMLDAIRKNGADLLVFGHIGLDQSDRVRREKKYPEFVRSAEEIRMDYSDYAGLKTKYGIQGAPWNKLYDLELIKKHGVAFPALRRHEDEVFIARYMCHATRVQFIEDVLYTHYINSLALEWRKVPADYADMVRTLYASRQETILTWNPQDTKTRQVIHEEYVDNMVKALELSYSPRHSFANGRERREWVIRQVEASGICKFEIYSDYSMYKKIILNILKRKKYRLAMTVMRLKTLVEKRGMDWMSRKYS